MARTFREHLATLPIERQEEIHRGAQELIAEDKALAEAHFQKYLKKPARVSQPGNILRLELKARDWSNDEFAEWSELPLEVVDGLLTAEQPITADIAKKLATVFGTSEGVWLNLEKNYREHLAAKTPKTSGEKVRT